MKNSRYRRQFKTITKVNSEIGDGIVVFIQNGLNVCHHVAKMTQMSCHVTFAAKQVTGKCQQNVTTRLYKTCHNNHDMACYFYDITTCVTSSVPYQYDK